MRPLRARRPSAEPSRFRVGSVYLQRDREGARRHARCNIDKGSNQFHVSDAISVHLMRDGSAAIANQQLAHLDGGPCDAIHQAAINSLTLWVISAGSYGFGMKSAPAGKLSSVTFTCPEVMMIFTGGHRPRT